MLPPIQSVPPIMALMPIVGEGTSDENVPSHSCQPDASPIATDYTHQEPSQQSRGPIEAFLLLS